jgi:hypothetical protein
VLTPRPLAQGLAVAADELVEWLCAAHSSPSAAMSGRSWGRMPSRSTSGSGTGCLGIANPGTCVNLPSQPGWRRSSGWVGADGLDAFLWRALVTEVAPRLEHLAAYRHAARVENVLHAAHDRSAWSVAPAPAWGVFAGTPTRIGPNSAPSSGVESKLGRFEPLVKRSSPRGRHRVRKLVRGSLRRSAR